MRALTIDTATSSVAIGLIDGDRILDAPPVREPVAAQHVLRGVDALLASAGVGIGEVERIIVGRGPGSFTGLRIGIATALGLARARDVDLVGVPTTSVLCRAAGPDGCAVVDARRGEVFVEAPGREPLACAPGDLAGLAAPGSRLIGDGAVRYRDELAGYDIPDDDSPLHVPSAAAFLALAEQGGPWTPLYVRAPDAVPTAER